jgi:HAD superfamily hydrolase (TIGR01509 family)
MDGTLTEPMLDFPAIKAEMGIGSTPILEAMEQMSPAQRQRADQILQRHESTAAASSILAPGCAQLLDWAAKQNLRTAVITRNSRASVDAFLDRHRLPIDAHISREDCPFKPHPAPLLLACQRLGVEAGECVMIGDGQYDIEAGRAAGIRTIWLSLGRPRPFAAQPAQQTENLHTLRSLLVGELRSLQ